MLTTFEPSGHVPFTNMASPQVKIKIFVAVAAPLPLPPQVRRGGGRGGGGGRGRVLHLAAVEEQDRRRDRLPQLPAVHQAGPSQVARQRRLLGNHAPQVQDDPRALRLHGGLRKWLSSCVHIVIN